MKPSTIRRLISGVTALSLSIPVMAQVPSLPEPRPKPTRPVEHDIQRQKNKTPVHTAARVSVNTKLRAKFDIEALKLHEVSLTSPRMRGSMVQADDLNISVVLQNSGSSTFAFPGNQIDASIIEGYFDYRQRVNIDRRHIPYYPARGTFDIAVPRGGSIELPIVIRGQRSQRVAYFPVPSPFRKRPDVRAVHLESGNRPISIRPDVWYTIDARLTPADDDEIDLNHAVFLNLRFDKSGTVIEMQGPYVY